MYSRAYILLQREFQELKKNNYEVSTGDLEDFLDNTHKWNRSYTLSSILLTLQVMLSNPVLENPVNLEAAHILIKDETLYRQIILRLFHQPLQCKKCLHIVICQLLIIYSK
ncbi:hypothetical protein J1605_012613 [Eschrichtius robustus]|uniref:UBC core domain-containing protein n=1 Tax=Eschrichtius robustus TaxID=9764 RepID=A0AB34GJG8_ESCRO|nr:hypothetical protein J1605_012613 [Eschrichtius robustus]